jgi:hypothetical protein
VARLRGRGTAGGEGHTDNGIAEAPFTPRTLETHIPEIFDKLSRPAPCGLWSSWSDVPGWA